MNDGGGVGAATAVNVVEAEAVRPAASVQVTVTVADPSDVGDAVSAVPPAGPIQSGSCEEIAPVEPTLQV